ncbi:hypothetical protein Hanom_Chr06g00488871 [Helianthus anomalus]
MMDYGSLMLNYKCTWHGVINLDNLDVFIHHYFTPTTHHGTLRNYFTDKQT